jgi:hypothetical protein
MFATMVTWLLSLREPRAVRVAHDKRRLEELLRSEGVSKAAAVRIVGAYFTRGGRHGPQ